MSCIPNITEIKCSLQNVFISSSLLKEVENLVLSPGVKQVIETSLLHSILIEIEENSMYRGLRRKCTARQGALVSVSSSREKCGKNR